LSGATSSSFGKGDSASRPHTFLFSEKIFLNNTVLLPKIFLALIDTTGLLSHLHSWRQHLFFFPARFSAVQARKTLMEGSL
jgi:hypothetical protein